MRSGLCLGLVLAACSGGAGPGDIAPIVPPETPDGGTATTPPPTMAGVTLLGFGTDFLDVSSDQGGNVWGATAGRIYFYRGGAEPGIGYDTSSGLAHGKTTWVDTYWFGTPASPSTQAVSFTSVAGGVAGEAFVGNIGYIGDRLQVDPGSGAVESIEGLEVTAVQQPKPDELAAQQQREVATWRAVVDLNGAFGGTAYFGGWHGTSALHGLTLPRATSVCGCSDYEEHVHAFSADGNDVYGGDVRGLAITAAGDLWMGDRKAVYFLPQGSIMRDIDFFQPVGVPGQPGVSALDVFPGVDDWTYGLAVDAAGGIYVASLGNGLAYLAPGSYAPTYFTLPTSDLTGVDIDPSGEVWIATRAAGALRYSPALKTFTQYTTKSGLPSNRMRQVRVDRYAATGRAVYFATDQGIAIYTGP